MNRREFLGASTLLASGLNSIAADASAPPAPRGPNEQLRVAILGASTRGRVHVGNFAGRHNCLVTVVCDPDRDMIGPAMKTAERAQGKAPRYEKDLRKVIESDDVDAVTIATPNHWHALAAIWALEQGKHVYVEKPVSHNVREGRLLVDAARKHQRICQAGIQGRSMTGMRRAIQFLHDGHLGKIKLVRGLCYKPRFGIGKLQGKATLPARADYDLWCGPAPNNPPRRKKLHYDWHWFWDYGNGDLGNQGVHQIDIARWGLGLSGLPNSVLSLGGRYLFNDDGETPNSQVTLLDYGDAQILFEVRNLPSKHFLGADIGNVFHGSKGYLVCPTNESAVAYGPDGRILQVFQGDGDHYGNFIHACRSGKTDDLHAPIEEGHISSALCHLGNISYRLGKEVSFDTRPELLPDSSEASAAWKRMTDHLKECGIDLAAANYRIGRRLTIDPKKESIADDREANQLLTREYRKGFELT